MNKKIEIVTLRITQDCPDRVRCPSRHKVKGIPGQFLVGKQVTDPGLLAAFAEYVGEDEVLSWTPDDVLSEA